jgi:hypothetical protein
MRRFASSFVLVALAGGLAGCAAQVPDSAAGVGFQDYDGYAQQQMERERALSGSGNVAPLGDPEAAALGAEAVAAVGAEPAGGASPAAATAAAAATDPAEAGISDEQSFEAVAARETIESDRERLQQQRSQYRVIQPVPVPQQAGERPNIVQYALNTDHVPGTELYGRSPFKLASTNRRNCSKYATQDLAQEAFLRNGGPHRDSENLDPDGDGFACNWSPVPFRRAVRR